MPIDANESSKFLAQSDLGERLRIYNQNFHNENQSREFLIISSKLYLFKINSSETWYYRGQQDSH